MVAVVDVVAAIAEAVRSHLVERCLQVFGQAIEEVEGSIRVPSASVVPDLDPLVVWVVSPQSMVYGAVADVGLVAAAAGLAAVGSPEAAMVEAPTVPQRPVCL